jgi:hypothetical protein
MKIGKLWAAGVLIASLAGAPAFAQMGNSMSSDPAMSSPPSSSEHAMPAKPMKMTDAEHAKMKSCMKMSTEMMAKDAECVGLKAMHDESMKHKSGGM